MECEEFAKTELIHPIVTFMENIDEVMVNLESIENYINSLQSSLNILFKTPHITSEKLVDCIVEVESIYRHIESSFSSIHVIILLFNNKIYIVKDNGFIISI